MEYVLLHESHGAMCAQLKKYAQLRVIGTVVRRNRERVLVQFDAPGERPTRHWVIESRLTPYESLPDPLEGQVTLRPSASFAEVSAFALGRVPKAARPTRREQTTGGAPPAATSPRPVRSAPVAPEAAASVPVPPVAGTSAPVPPGLRSPALTVRPGTGLPTEPVTPTSVRRGTVGRVILRQKDRWLVAFARPGELPTCYWPDPGKLEIVDSTACITGTAGAVDGDDPLIRVTMTGPAGEETVTLDAQRRAPTARPSKRFWDDWR